ncbi:MAG TPA: hypothetical protein VFP34_16695 [Microlunatus sp.]|nr:hypothetical protein [Microlunatus sp.]
MSCSCRLTSLFQPRLFGAVAEGVVVGELIVECISELRGWNVVVAAFAHVG